MARGAQIILFGSAVVAAIAAADYRKSLAQDLDACVDLRSTKAETMDAHTKVATAQQPAEIVPKDGPTLLSSSPALQLTLRPTAADPDSPFLAQVFARNCSTNGNGPGQLVGVVSFFPLKIGQSQEFVLVAPDQGFPSTAPQNVQLTVKLIPANPARTLQNASLEVVKARFAR